MWWPRPKSSLFIDAVGAKKLQCHGCGEYNGPWRSTAINLDRATVGDRQIFYLVEGAKRLFVTETIATRIRDIGLTNVGLTEAGEIID